MSKKSRCLLGFFVFVLVVIALALYIGIKNNSGKNLRIKKIFDIEDIANDDLNTSWSVISIKESQLIVEQRYTDMAEDYTKQLASYNLKTGDTKTLFRFEDKKVVIMSSEMGSEGYYVSGYELVNDNDSTVKIKSFIAYIEDENYQIIYENWIESFFETNLLYEVQGQVVAFIGSSIKTSNEKEVACSELVKLNKINKVTLFRECEGFYPKSLKNVEVSQSGILLFEIRKNDDHSEFKSVMVDLDGNVRGKVTYQNPVSVFVELGNKLITTYWDVNGNLGKTDVSRIDISDLHGKNVSSSTLFTPENSEKPNIVYSCEPMDQNTMFCNTSYDINQSNYQTMGSNPYVVTLVEDSLKFEKLPLNGVYPNHTFTQIDVGVVYMGTYLTNEDHKTIFAIFEIRKEK